MKLQALKFEPILKPVIWGGDSLCKYKSLQCEQLRIGESWEVSTHGDDISVVSQGDFKGLNLKELLSSHGEAIMGSRLYATFRDEFPILIKFIGAHDDLSLQVHPNDELAHELSLMCGKTEMWYVVDAEPGAKLYAGFSKDIDSSDFKNLATSGDLLSSLKAYEVKPGDVFYLPAGIVHSIGRGMIVAEIQQSSDVTYRIFDYNRVDSHGNKRELHTEMAAKAIDFDQNKSSCKVDYDKAKHGLLNLVSSPYFITNRVLSNEVILRDLQHIDSPVVYLWISGSGQLKDELGNIISMHQGESVLIPANHDNVSIIPTEESVVLEVYIA